MVLEAGRCIGPYEVIAPVGAGGMGEVYRARDVRLDREIALKVLPEAAGADEIARERLMREARTASKLNHPNVCTIHDVGEDHGDIYFAMEMVSGRTLSDVIAGGPLPLEEVVLYGGQVADALAHAHAHGIVHRDLKSANIVITSDGRAKVLDFGLAKRLPGEIESEATTLTNDSLTAAGAVAGTPAYMAPEQLQGKAADARSDIWSLGIVLYEMATGKRPFSGQTGYQLSAAILHDPPPALPPSVPGAVDAVIERCLAKDPERRYQGAAEVRAALETVAMGETPSVWSELRTWVVRHRVQTLVAGTSTLLAVLAGLNIGDMRSHFLGTAGDGRVIRMAVLPFANLSGDPEEAYLADGLTQEMIAQLGRLHPETLNVIARTSVMRYKNTDTPIDQIGRELNVDYVLEGSAQREGSRVRISAELIGVKNQSQLWAGSFEREMSGILALQADVTGKVADSLALKLLPNEKTLLASTRTVDPEAYDVYLKGSHQWVNFATPGDLDTAEKYFDLALEKDPSYAPAYVGRAWLWIVRNQVGWSPPEEAGPKAKAAALRAIELDKESSSAYEALALVRTFIDWDWDGSWEPWHKSLEINPNAATAQGAFAQFLTIVGRGDEALIHGKRSVVLDPFNPLVRSWYAFTLYSQRRNDEAIEAAREALRYQPDFLIANNLLWWAYEKTGAEKEALEAAKALARIGYDDPRIVAALDDGYDRGGYAEAMKRGAEALIARLPEEFCLPSDIAMFYVSAGEKTKSLDWLEKGLKIHDPMLPYLGYPFFDTIRADPRFQDIMSHVDLRR